MRAQITEKGNEPEWAVVPHQEYLVLVEAREMLDDGAAFDAAVAAEEELVPHEVVPHEVVRRLIAGAPPLRVWRDDRGLASETLTNRAGIGTVSLARLESGQRTGSPRGLARALDVTTEDLLTEACPLPP